MFTFEVSSNHANALFENENDALTALWLIGLYHDFDIKKKEIKRALDEEGYYEKFPLAIQKVKA